MASSDGAFGGLATVQVGDGDAGDHGGGSGGENFVAVVEHQQQVGAQLVQGVGEAQQAQVLGFGDADRGVGAEQHHHPTVDAKAVGLYLPVGLDHNSALYKPLSMVLKVLTHCYTERLGACDRSWVGGIMINASR